MKKQVGLFAEGLVILTCFLNNGLIFTAMMHLGIPPWKTFLKLCWTGQVLVPSAWRKRKKTTACELNTVDTIIYLSSIRGNRSERKSNKASGTLLLRHQDRKHPAKDCRKTFNIYTISYPFTTNRRSNRKFGD